uniref:ATP synthase F0 subunit 8 n=1 Tax=Limnoria quadripunctata TaxID=161573 RepID=A0A023IWQ2_LIMQU|nr:ATP synthase F0 subunit 8 [Limnoria quadripunctata]
MPQMAPLFWMNLFFIFNFCLSLYTIMIWAMPPKMIMKVKKQTKYTNKINLW